MHVKGQHFSTYAEEALRLLQLVLSAIAYDM